MLDYSRYSVRRKLLFISVVSVGLALVTALGALIFYERSVFRDEQVRRLSTHAEIIAFNTESALLFDDRDSAKRTLAALKAEPDLEAVRILDRGAKPFVEYIRKGTHPPPELDLALPGEVGEQFLEEHMILTRPILSEGSIIGSVVIVSDLDALQGRVWNYLAIAAAVFVISLLTSLFLSMRLYRSISVPLRELVLTAREVTAAKNYSVRARVDSTDELGMLAESFNQMLSQIEQRDATLRTTLDSVRVARDSAENAAKVKAHFLSLVSHELRTPLTALQLNLENLRRSREPLPTRVASVLERMRSSTKRQAELVESLLEYSRLESGKLTTNVGAVDLAEVIHEVVDEIRPQADQKHLRLHVDLATVPPLFTDARLVRLVLVNFIGNSVKFTNKGSVGVRLVVEGPFHRVDVTDTGPGIPKANLEQIFEPFEHVEPIDGKHTPGFGLGLTLVKQMAEVLEARIAVQSEVGVGTTFSLFLPALEPEEASPSPDPASGNRDTR